MNKKEIFKKATFIREIENYFLSMFSKGLLNGTVHTCVGQEMVPIVINQYTTKNDQFFSNHRGHGHYLSNGGCYKKLILELMGNSEGVSKGVGGSQHIYDNNFISNGIQGGLAPVAVGFSYAESFLKTNNISVCYVGDGTLGEGQFYEALVLAKIFNTRTLFVIENNGYAQSTSTESTVFGDLKKRFEGFGLDFFSSSIWDLDNLDKISQEAINNARQGNPSILEVKCYRLNSHSKGDDNRDVNEVKKYAAKDPLNKFKIQNEEWYENYRKELWDDFDSITTNTPLSKIDISILKNDSLIDSQIEWKPEIFKENELGLRQNEMINIALDNVISKENAILIGEDILDKTKKTPSQYGGAFKVTRGLSTKYPENVKNSSISEAGIVGFGIGAALNNHPTIVEIMFGDFMTLTLDQLIQQASKIPQMYGKNVNLPLTIRTPMGGRRGYGPTHSQNLEKIFLFWPNIEVIAINCLCSPNEIYSKSSISKKTTILVEDKVSYTQTRNLRRLEDFKTFRSDENFPTYKILPDFADPNITICCYGAMLGELIEVLPELVDNEIFPVIISPTMISPLNINILTEGDICNDSLVFIEEGSKRTSWSSEIIASLNENGSKFNKISRISNEYIIPCSRELEEKIFPSRLTLFDKIIEVISRNG